MARVVDLTIDDRPVRAPEDATLLEVCRDEGAEIPTLCYGDTITPKNACRVCMVEVEGSRVLVPSCSRKVEPGMVVRTATERTRHSRRLVLELLGSSVDLSLAGPLFRRFADLLTLARVDVYGGASEAALEQIRGKAQLLGNAPVLVHDLHAGFTRFAGT